MFQRDKKNKNPGVYSIHINQSCLGLYFRKKVEGVRGGRQRVKEGGGQAVSRIGEAYQCDAHLSRRLPPLPVSPG